MKRNKWQLDYKRMLQEIDGLVSGDSFCEDMEYKGAFSQHITQTEARKMAKRLADIFMISHCIHRRACGVKYLLHRVKRTGKSKTNGVGAAMDIKYKEIGGRPYILHKYGHNIKFANQYIQSDTWTELLMGDEGQDDKVWDDENKEHKCRMCGAFMYPDELRCHTCRW